MFSILNEMKKNSNIAEPIRLKMPALSPTMTEGQIIKWHKKEGNFHFNIKVSIE